MTAAPKKPRSRAFVGIVVALALLGACVPCVGILAAVAIPGFIGYVRRSKVAEARANVRAIVRGVAVAYEMETIEGGAAVHALPPRAPRTPASVGPERQLWPATADPAWNAIGFAPAEPLYYAYEYEPDADGRGFAVRAHGDLDGDGVESTIELRGTVDPSTGEISYPSEPTVENELE